MITLRRVDAAAIRIAYIHGRNQGRDTLEQRFRFDGPGVDAHAVTQVLLTAPLTGEDSIFGERPGEQGDTTDQSRSVSGFSPAPGFRFDVSIAQRTEGLMVTFSQPERDVPYLQGDALWVITNDEDGAMFDEQINTRRALDAGAEPLGGPRFSLRRWLFFRMGHRQVMLGASKNIATIPTE